MTYRREYNIRIYSRWCLHCVEVYRTEPLRTDLKDGGEELTNFTLPNATNYVHGDLTLSCKYDMSAFFSSSVYSFSFPLFYFVPF